MIILKVCSKCKQERNDTDFYVCSDGRIVNTCKFCQHEYDKARAESRKAYRKTYNDNHKEQYKLYREQHKEEIKQRMEIYTSTLEYKKKKAEYDKQYNQEHRQQRIDYSREYRKNNPIILTEEQKQQKREYMRKYREKNKDIINKKKLKENMSQMQVLSHTMSSAIYRVLKGIKSDRHWEDIVGYSIQDLKEHLEKQFTPEMNWNNMGKYWEIDHIIPLNLFNYESEQDEQFKICWSLMNLRPLEKIANKSRPKNGRDIPKEQAINILGHDLYYDIMYVE